MAAATRGRTLAFRLNSSSRASLLRQSSCVDPIRDGVETLTTAGVRRVVTQRFKFGSSQIVSSIMRLDSIDHGRDHVRDVVVAGEYLLALGCASRRPRAIDFADKIV
jgi:hypothetical protein